MTDTNENDQVRSNVRSTYAQIASITASAADDCCAPTSACCGPTDTEAKSQLLGYSADELKSLPDGANLGAGLWQPTGYREPETG